MQLTAADILAGWDGVDNESYVDIDNSSLQFTVSSQLGGVVVTRGDDGGNACDGKKVKTATSDVDLLLLQKERNSDPSIHFSDLSDEAQVTQLIAAILSAGWEGIGNESCAGRDNN